MIKNILKQLWNQRKANIWIATELLLVSIFLWIIIDQIVYQYDRFNRPMGFDIKDTYSILINHLGPSSKGYISEEESGSSSREDILTILSRLRKVDGVEEVTATSCARPYCSCNSQSMFMSKHGNDSIAHSAFARLVSPEYFKVFRIQTPDGYSPAGQVFQHQIVLSKDLADTLKVSRGDSIFSSWNNLPLIVDICIPIRYAETWSDIPNGYFVVPETEMISMRWPDDIAIRLRENLSEDQRIVVWENIKAACQINNISFFVSTPYKDLRKQYIASTVDQVKSMSWYAVFLIINIFLGIIGTFWFRTQQRRSEIGLRLAIGATPRSLFTQLTGEGLLLFSTIFIPAIIVVLNIWYLGLLSPDHNLFRFFVCMLTTWFLVAIMITAGIWYPARQAMKVKPAEALHDE